MMTTVGTSARQPSGAAPGPGVSCRAGAGHEAIRAGSGRHDDRITVRGISRLATCATGPLAGVQQPHAIPAARPPQPCAGGHDHYQGSGTAPLVNRRMMASTRLSCASGRLPASCGSCAV
jgi:hypothetical protein